MKARIGISNVTVNVPPGRESVSEVLEKHPDVGASEAKFMERIHELKSVSKLGSSENLASLLRATISQFLDSGVAAESLDFVLYAHSILVQQPYHESLLANVLQESGLGGVPYWGVSQLNCASGLAGAELASRLVKQRESVKRVLLLTGDATGSIPEARYIARSTVMGDSASAILIEPNAEYEFLSFAWVRDNRFCEGFYATPEDQTKFGEIYQTHLTQVAREACHRAGTSLEQIDWIVPHNVNMTTWRRFCKNTHFPRERVFSSLLSEIGHSYCNDNFLNLNAMKDEALIQAGQTLLFLSVGVGSYFGASVLKRHAVMEEK